MDHPLRIEPRGRRNDRFGIEIELQDVVRLDQLRPARARQQVAAGVIRMAHADVAEGIEHALVGQHAVGERELVTHFI